MEKKNYNDNSLRGKISRFIYKRGVNTSSRDRSTPQDNDRIDEEALISIINFGIDLDSGVMSIRARFHGSMTFYSVPFEFNKYEEWVQRLRELHKECNIDIDNESDDDLDF